MNHAIPNKIYFRIGEVSKILGVAPYVIRYWESEFRSVRPLRTETDQRLYKKKDVETLLLIKGLLYDEMYTIAGAKKRLTMTKRKENSDTGKGQPVLGRIKKELLEIHKLLS